MLRNELAMLAVACLPTRLGCSLPCPGPDVSLRFVRRELSASHGSFSMWSRGPIPLRACRQLGGFPCGGRSYFDGVFMSGACEPGAAAPHSRRRTCRRNAAADAIRNPIPIPARLLPRSVLLLPTTVGCKRDVALAVGCCRRSGPLRETSGTTEVDMSGSDDHLTRERTIECNRRDARKEKTSVEGFLRPRWGRGGRTTPLMGETGSKEHFQSERVHAVPGRRIL